MTTLAKTTITHSPLIGGLHWVSHYIQLPLWLLVFVISVHDHQNVNVFQCKIRRLLRRLYERDRGTFYTSRRRSSSGDFNNFHLLFCRKLE
ncbi:unnamed protein product [Meloidogyne enterolobii]|uniref:Uncharacterized protein n=1 Tax=Meloidogyne enterolobii TaxID=390850 RepID=A0ACB0XVD3_MELEN